MKGQLKVWESRWKQASIERDPSTAVHSLLLVQNPADGKYWAESENGGGRRPVRIASDGKTNPRRVVKKVCGRWTRMGAVGRNGLLPRPERRELTETREDGADVIGKASCMWEGIGGSADVVYGGSEVDPEEGRSRMWGVKEEMPSVFSRRRGAERYVTRSRVVVVVEGSGSGMVEAEGPEGG